MVLAIVVTGESIGLLLNGCCKWVADLSKRKNAKKLQVTKVCQNGLGYPAKLYKE